MINIEFGSMLIYSTQTLFLMLKWLRFDKSIIRDPVSIPSQLFSTSSPLRYVASRLFKRPFSFISVKGMAHLFLWRRRRVNEHDLPLARWSLLSYKSSHARMPAVNLTRPKTGNELLLLLLALPLWKQINNSNHFFHSILKPSNYKPNNAHKYTFAKWIECSPVNII